MKNILNTILFGLLIATMILPFSSMGVTHATADQFKDIKNMEDQIADTEKQISKLEKKISSTEKKIANLEKKILHIQDNLDNTTDKKEIKKIEKNLVKLEKKLQNLEKKIEKFERKVANLDSNLLTFYKKFDSMVLQQVMSLDQKLEKPITEEVLKFVGEKIQKIEQKISDLEDKKANTADKIRTENIEAKIGKEKVKLLDILTTLNTKEVYAKSQHDEIKLAKISQKEITTALRKCNCDPEMAFRAGFEWHAFGLWGTTVSAWKYLDSLDEYKTSTAYTSSLFSYDSITPLTHAFVTPHGMGTLNYDMSVKSRMNLPIIEMGPHQKAVVSNSYWHPTVWEEDVYENPVRGDKIVVNASVEVFP